MNAPTFISGQPAPSDFNVTSQSEINFTSSNNNSQLEQAPANTMTEMAVDDAAVKDPSLPVSIDIEEPPEIVRFQERAQLVFPPNVVIPFVQVAEQCLTLGAPDTMLSGLYDQGVITGQIGPEIEHQYEGWMTEEQRNNPHETGCKSQEVYTNHRSNYHTLCLMKVKGQFEDLGALAKHLATQPFHLATYIESLQHKYGDLDLGIPVSPKTVQEGTNVDGKFELYCITEGNAGDAMFIDLLRHHLALKHTIKKTQDLEDENLKLRAELDELKMQTGKGLKKAVLDDLGDLMSGLNTGSTTRDKNKVERNFKVAKAAQKTVRQRLRLKVVLRPGLN